MAIDFLKTVKDAQFIRPRGFTYPIGLSTEGVGGPTSVDYLVVAGGGAGGTNLGTGIYANSGAGAGGFRTSTNFGVTQGTSYAITVGAGGTTNLKGSNSVFSSITSLGGGSSSGEPFADRNGGSGAGAGDPVAFGPGPAGLGTPGQGNNGGNAPGGSGTSGGGGGAGSAGSGSTNGSGTASPYSGSPVTYAVGGAGVPGGNGEAGSENTGNGGAGKSGSPGSQAGGSGGKGIVIIRYSGSQGATGGTITSSGGYTIHTFTGDGTFRSNAISYSIN